ncbi:MAG TPA: OmpA family protein [Stellaceae bacterium]|nr:OmpA family protein [Stellaceae bacterium]
MSATIARRLAAALAVSVVTVLVAGCTPQANYDELQARYQQTEAANQKLQADNAQLQAQLGQQAQQNTYTVAADLLFAPGNFDITANGQAALNDIAGKLKVLKNSKIVVYGYTDDQGIGEALKKQGIKTNLDLSSKRADVVADFLHARGVDPKILLAKGRGETHPVTLNNTVAGRAQNRRIEIVVEGPGN